MSCRSPNPTISCWAAKNLERAKDFCCKGYGGIATKLTLVLSDLRWLAELRDRQLLGRGGVQIPGIDERKLLAMGLIEEKTGGSVLTRKGRDVLERRG